MANKEPTEMTTAESYHWAADQAQESADNAIFSARTTKYGFEKSNYLSVAAQKLRDVKTFEAAATMSELFD